MNCNFNCICYIPIESLCDYAQHYKWGGYCKYLRSELRNVCKKINYKKAIKYIKKGAKYLPWECVLEMRLEIDENGKTDL